MPDDGHQEALRFGLAPAPSGLVLVQELINTATGDGHATDLLADVSSARAWLEGALALWSAQAGRPRPSLELAAEDLPELRAVREELRAALAGRPATAAGPTRTVALVLEDGKVTQSPTGGGADGLAGLAYAELLLAGQTDARRRLKVCANEACGAAYYDASRNASRVWHDVRTCGNVANLRASRARRAARADP
jgi:predicted RNA-binding Zn ribbon-like protein